MRISVKVALLFTLASVTISLLLWYAGAARDYFRPMLFIAVFLLMSAIATGLFLTKRSRGFEEGFFLNDFKTGMQSGMLYAVLYSSYTYCYHTTIDPSIQDHLIQLQIEALHRRVPDAAAYAALQAEDASRMDESYDDYIEMGEDEIRSVVSAISVSAFHLMGLTFFSFFFSFFITFILRKVVLRHPRSS